MSATAVASRSRTRAGKKKTKKSSRTAPGWLSWWPVALGIAVTPFAMRAADILALRGPESLRMLYPYVDILRNHTPWLSTTATETAAQAMMYLQFPLYGLFLKIALRTYHFLIASIQTAVLHTLGLGFLMALAYFHN